MAEYDFEISWVWKKKTTYLSKNLVNLFMLCLAVLIIERNIADIVCCVNM